MKEDTKASDWRSRERCAGSVAVGAGVGVGEAEVDGLGEAVGAPDWPDWLGLSVRLRLLLFGSGRGWARSWAGGRAGSGAGRRRG